MASMQRRRGQQVVIYPTKEIVDNRGHTVAMADMDHPVIRKAAVIPQRSSKAELPGQQDIHTVRLILDNAVSGLDSWSRVLYMGEYWDVMVPPQFHAGSRHVRHYTIDVRRRPSG